MYGLSIACYAFRLEGCWRFTLITRKKNKQTFVMLILNILEPFKEHNDLMLLNAIVNVKHKLLQTYLRHSTSLFKKVEIGTKL